MNNTELGIKNFRRRLVFGIRDSVLLPLSDRKSLAQLTGMPESELGALSDLRDDQIASLAHIVARSIDTGIHHFLYSLDNQADGFEIRYNGELLNEEGLYQLSHRDAPLADESIFDQNGQKKEGA